MAIGSCKMLSYSIFICVFLISNEVEHNFISLLVICVYSFWTPVCVCMHFCVQMPVFVFLCIVSWVIFCCYFLAFLTSFAYWFPVAICVEDRWRLINTSYVAIIQPRKTVFFKITHWNPVVIYVIFYPTFSWTLSHCIFKKRSGTSLNDGTECFIKSFFLIFFVW